LLQEPHGVNIPEDAILDIISVCGSDMILHQLEAEHSASVFGRLVKPWDRCEMNNPRNGTLFFRVKYSMPATLFMKKLSTANSQCQ
jgi:hypothetical protein